MLLAIDSGSVSASAALLNGDVLIAESFQNSGLTHSRTLIPMIDALIRNADVTPKDIRRLVVTNGPGSFTGLRIGVSSALGFAGALNIPCAGVSTLAAAAFGARDFCGTVAAALDARRDEYYCAAFLSQNGVLTRLWEDCALSRDELERRLPSPPVCWTGDSAGRLARSGDRVAARPYPSAYGAALCFLAGESRPAERIRYLRLPQAERERRLS